MSEDQRARNRARLRDVEERLTRVRDKLATVVAEAGPLFREVGELVDEVNALLSPPAEEQAVEEPKEEAA